MTPVDVPTPAQRLRATRLSMQKVLQTGPWPELQMARRAAREMAQRYPLATVVVVVAAATLLVSTKPWRWLRPSSAMKVALAQLAWRTAEGLVQAAVQQRRPLQTELHSSANRQAGVEKKA